MEETPNVTRRAVVGTMVGLTLSGATPSLSAIVEPPSGGDTTAKPDAATGSAPPPFPVTIQVNAKAPIGKMTPIWRFFGADEPNYAYMRDGKKLLGELGALAPDHVYFRTHNLLTSGDGTPALKWGSTNAYTEDAQGRPVYDWTILDHVFDTYREHHVRPYVQIGFMPEALSIKPEPYRHHWTSRARYEDIYTGWAFPPKDYARWEELVFQWAKHCVARYGQSEVETWYWETWNEANIGYWRGTAEEFRRLHDHAIAGVRRALPSARVGGCDSAGDGGKFMQDFLEHCLRGKNFATGAIGTPLDFLAFHAKGAPQFIAAPDGTGAGHVRMGIAAQLRTIDTAFARFASFPELKDKPIVIGESDPEGCAACQGPQFGYRNGTVYSSYTAASFARKYLLADRHQVNLHGATTWAFEFEDQPLFDGFRVLASGGIDLPVLNVFRMMSRMSGERVATHSSAEVPLDEIIKTGVRGETPDVAALAARDGHKLACLVWHYHDDDLPGPDAHVTINLSGLAPGAATLSHWRIDDAHSNAYAAWKAIGSPAVPTDEQYRRLEQAGQLARLADTPGVVTVDKDGLGVLSFSLPRQGVSLLVLSA